MKSKYTLASVIYVFVFLIFLILTIVGFNEFWPSTLREGNFTYSVLFVCFLETLVFALLILESIGYFEKFVSTQNLFMVVGSLLLGYIVLSIILLIIGNAYYLFLPSLLYISTIGFTFLFIFILTWYVNRIVTDKNIDEFDKNGRKSRIILTSLFDNMKMNIASNSTLMKHKLYSDIVTQLEILSRKIKTSSLSKFDNSTKELDEAILRNIEIISNSLTIREQETEDVELAEKVLFQLNLMKENLSHRESVLKI